VRPTTDIQLIVNDIRTEQLFVFRVLLIDFASVDFEIYRSWIETAHAGAFEVDREAEAKGEATAGPGDIEADGWRCRRWYVRLPTHLHRLQPNRQVEALALSM